LKPKVYWIEGGGGNSGVIIGDKGVIVVDAKTTPAGGKELLDDIAKITPKPVTTVILTHSDGDHVNGLASFPAGITIIAHEGNKKEQEAALAGGGRGAPPAEHQPTQVITKNKENLKLDGVKLEVLHWAPAHTSGDLVIYLPVQKIVFGGDLLVTNRPDTNIHVDKQGSVAGWMENVKGMIALDADTYVTGHGDLMTKDDAKKKLAYIQERWDKVKAMAAQGKSLDDVKTAMGESTAPPVANAQGNMPAPTITEVMYNEVKKKS
jgi:glyoxylase-like metal-dependent hydrolase (beta-lactamase superfamily II)